MSNTKTIEAGERTQHSAGWFYAKPEEVLATIKIPVNKRPLISDKGEFGYQVYSDAGFSIQLVVEGRTH